MEHEDKGIHHSRKEGKSAGNESNSAGKAQEKPSGKLPYVPPRMIEYGDISELRRAGKQYLADLFKHHD